MMRACAATLRSIASATAPALSGGRRCCRSTQAHERSAFSGVRSSCDTAEMNSSFRRFASRASLKTAFSIAIAVICAS